MERTLALLGRELAGAATGPDGAGRLAAVLGAVAAGYAHALQDRTRAEQEQITASTFMARAAAEQARWSSEARFQAVFDDAVIGIGVADIDGRRPRGQPARWARCSAAAPRTWSAPRCGATSTPTTGRSSGTRSTSSPRAPSTTSASEKAYYRDDGTEIWTDWWCRWSATRTGRPRYLVAMVEDITERHRLRTRLRHQASHDPLTGLPNRTLFFERLDAALAADGASVGRLLPGPRRVQGGQRHPRPRHGRRAAAGRRRAARRPRSPTSHLVARMGGDEFVVLIDRDADDERLPRVADSRAGDRRGDPCVLGDHEIVDLGERRHRASGRRRHARGRADAGRRHHAVLGQGRRRRPLRPVRRRAPPPTTSAGSRSRRGCPRRWPAASSSSSTSRWSGWRTAACRGRGAGPLDAARRAAARPGPVHPAGRGHRAHRAAGPLGAARRPAGRPPAGRRRPGDRGCSSASTSRPGRCANPAWSTTSATILAETGLAAGAAPARADRERADGHRPTASLAAAARAGRHGRAHRHRRLRHRLLQPGLPAPPAGAHAQAGRPFVTGAVPAVPAARRPSTRPRSTTRSSP